LLKAKELPQKSAFSFIFVLDRLIILSEISEGLITELRVKHPGYPVPRVLNKMPEKMQIPRLPETA
jgi:hypothetical protein